MLIDYTKRCPTETRSWSSEKNTAFYAVARPLRNQIAAFIALFGLSVILGADRLQRSLSRADGIARVDLGGAWQVVKEGDLCRFRPPCRAASIPICWPRRRFPIHFIVTTRMPRAMGGRMQLDLQPLRSKIEPAVLAMDHVLLRCEGSGYAGHDQAERHGAWQDRQHVPHLRVRREDVLKPGENKIEIKFDSALPYIQAKSAKRKLPGWVYPGIGYIRKEPCNFGWDWGPTLITCGIWRPISIVAFNQARLDDVLILQDHSQEGCRSSWTCKVAPRPRPRCP